MASVYRQALATPGAPRFVAAAFVGRIPISMFGVGTILYVNHATGSYATGGLVVTASSLGEALCAARFGRALDRYGQARVLVLGLGGHLVGLVGLVASVGLGWPHPLWYVCAALMGALFPATGTCARARWAAMLGDTDLLGAAFALESALDEVMFIGGPVLATVLATAVAPAAGLVASGVLLAVGTLALAAQRDSDPGPRAVGSRSGRVRVFRDPALRSLLFVTLVVGASFGAVDLATVAYGRAHGLGSLAGVLLACWAFGSGSAGLFFGARMGGTRFARNFLRAAAVMAVLLCLPVMAPNVWVLVPLTVIAGMTVAPTLIGANGAMERLVPASARTEGFAWLQVAVVTGVSLGSPLTGAVIDQHGARAGFAVLAAAGILIGLAAAAGSRALLRARPAAEDAVPDAAPSRRQEARSSSP